MSISGTTKTIIKEGNIMNKTTLRIIGAALSGVVVGGFSTTISAVLYTGAPLEISEIAVTSVLRVFVFTIFSIAGVLATEINLPEPKARRQMADEFEFGRGNAEVGKNEIGRRKVEVGKNEIGRRNVEVGK